MKQGAKSKRILPLVKQEDRLLEKYKEVLLTPEGHLNYIPLSKAGDMIGEATKLLNQQWIEEINKHFKEYDWMGSEDWKHIKSKKVADYGKNKS